MEPYTAISYKIGRTSSPFSVSETDKLSFIGLTRLFADNSLPFQMSEPVREDAGPDAFLRLQKFAERFLAECGYIAYDEQ